MTHVLINVTKVRSKLLFGFRALSLCFYFGVASFLEVSMTLTEILNPNP